MDLKLDNDALWKQRMRSPRIWRIAIARNNPSVGYVVSNVDGRDKTYLWNPQTRLIDNKPSLDGDYFGIFSPDGKFLHYFKDTKGNQRGHRWRMDVETGENEDLTPDLPDYFGYWTSFSEDSKSFAFIASVGNVSTIYLLSFDGDGKLAGRKQVIETTESIAIPRLSQDGKTISFSSTENGRIDNSSIFVMDTEKVELLKKFSAGDGTSSYPHMFLPNSTKIVISIEQGATEKGYIWDYKTDQLEELPLDSSCNNHIADITADGTKLLINQMSKARNVFHIYDLASKTTTTLEKLDGMSTSYQFAGNEIFIRNSCSKHKSRVLTYDIITAQRKSAFELPGLIETTQAQEVHFVGALGDQIYGWLKKPEGKGPFPTIIEMPGGPDCAWDFYDSNVYIDHGFARLYFSYHGGMSFGEGFRKSIHGRVGELELEDMVAARNWLVEQGIADPDKIFLAGGSYGGYLTLLGMVKRPDLWRGGLARIPVADFAMMVEDATG